MSSPETHDPIDKLLREQDAYIVDNGFSGRVVAALPRRRPVYPRIILLVVAIAGSAVAAFLMPWQNLPPFDFTQIFSSDSKVLFAWLPFIAVGVALASAAMAAARREN
jgi:hypothetical protein